MMSEEKTPVKTPAPAAAPPRRVKVMLLRDGVHGEMDANGRTRKHVMGDVIEIDEEAADKLYDLQFAKPVADKKKV